MSQEETVGELDDAVGYVLKQVSSALRTAMDAALWTLALTVPQYACLELVGQRAGLSNAELARGAFVTRQSTNVVLRGLQDRGLVTRASRAANGRALPTELTPGRRDVLHSAGVAIRGVEKRMLAPLSATGQRQLCEHLAACAAALTPRAGTA